MCSFPNLPSSYSSDISATHVNRLYACANFTLNLVRLRYWIPAGRQRVKKAINHGVTCKTIIGLPYNTLTHLFFQRKDTQEEPFTVSDVDFTRALYIREAVAEKRDYICFFTRGTTRGLPCSRYRFFGTNLRSRVSRICCPKVCPPTNDI